jgi:hypothetical protein
VFEELDARIVGGKARVRAEELDSRMGFAQVDDAPESTSAVTTVDRDDFAIANASATLRDYDRPFDSRKPPVFYTPHDDSLA